MKTTTPHPELALTVMNCGAGAPLATVGEKANDYGPVANRGVWPARIARTDTHRHGGFTLTEMIVAMAVLSILILMISSIFHQAQRGWIAAQNRTECYAEGRKILDAIVSDLQQAVAGGGVTFKGTATKMSMVATVNMLANNESADLCEVGYEYDADTRKLMRHYTGPIGVQPVMSGSGTKPPTYQAMSLGSLTAVTPWAGYARLGTHFAVNQTIYLTEVGIVDHNLDGLLTHADSPPDFWFMVLLQKNGGSFTLFDSWQMSAGSLVASSPPGYMFYTVSTTGIPLPPGEYKLYTTFFCSGTDPYNPAWDKILSGAPVFNGNGGVIARMGEVATWAWCWGATGANIVGDPTYVTASYQLVNFRYRLQQSGGSSSGTGLIVNDKYVPGGVTTTGTWDIYDGGWDSTWERSDALASNNVTAVSFAYGTDPSSLGPNHSGATLPNVVKVSVSVVDRRAAQALAVGGATGVALPSITNDWGHTFSTIVHLTNADH
jgi:prepilin-type N-terminal cleavage/methylation domain-containing protein